jgi:uncharacterized damage-inducible protein DinB
VAQTLAHIAATTSIWLDIHGAKKLTTLDGYDFEAVFAEMEKQQKKQRSKAEILDLLRTEGDKFAAFLDGLSDETLAQEIQEPGGGARKTRLEALLSAKEHEMHHRGQLMLVERMLGIVPHLTRRYEEMAQQYKEQQAQTAARGS